jgi:5-methyltetrahydrofolate--homocysteine methyltransferase
MPKICEIYEAVTRGNRQVVTEGVQAFVRGGGDIEGLLNETLIPAMREVGARFSRNEIYVPEMLIAARAMQAGLDIIEPLLGTTGHKARARVVIGTVKGDLHDIGKNLVAMMLKGAGFEVEDLGVDCSVERYADAVNRGADVICLSALLTTTMPYMKAVVDHFKERGNLKIIIGGAPVTREYAKEIGAHGYGSDANDAVHVVESLLAS